MQRMEFCRQYCTAAMSLGDATGFTEFERELVLGSTRISSLYGAYYFAYLEAVQDPAITTKLVMDPPSATTEADCYSHYTIVKHSEESGYSTVSFAAHFAEVLAPILVEMDALVAKLQALAAPDSEEHAAYIAFFQHYRLCHSSDVSAPELEELWSELDRKWMNMKVNCNENIGLTYVTTLVLIQYLIFYTRVISRSFTTSRPDMVTLSE
jgi:hypothetical protein